MSFYIRDFVSLRTGTVLFVQEVIFFVYRWGTITAICFLPATDIPINIKTAHPRRPDPASGVAFTARFGSKYIAYVSVMGGNREELYSFVLFLLLIFFNYFYIRIWSLAKIKSNLSIVKAFYLWFNICICQLWGLISRYCILIRINRSSVTRMQVVFRVS